MKRFACGFVLGTVVGGLLIWALAAPKNETTNIPNESPGTLAEAASWVFPREATIADIFIQPNQLEALRTPDAVSVHQHATTGIGVGDYFFDEKGVLLSGESLKATINCFRSLNSYTPPKACGFDPGLLVRFSKGEHHLDIMVCFRCDDIAWCYDGAKPESVSMMGLSRIGSEVLWMLARETWPTSPLYRIRPKH